MADPFSRDSASIPSGYNHHERILLSPTLRSKTIDWDVRLEQKLSLKDDSSITISPFPTSTAKALLQRFGATKMLLQVASAASTSFPESNFDLILSGNDLDRTRSSAGVTVSVEFLQSEETSTARLETDFTALLRELVGQRLLLASSLSTTHIKRLYRYIHHEIVVSKESQTVHRLSISFPTDAGAAFSAEGMTAWLEAWANQKEIDTAQRNKSIRQGLGGIWEVADGLAWSTWMIGTTTTNAHKRQKEWNPLSQKRRSIWLELQAAHAHRSGSEAGGYSLSLGMQYTARAPLSPVTSAPAASVALSLGDIMPASNPHLQVNALADSSTVQVALPKDSPIELKEWGSFCESVSSGTPPQYTSGGFSVCNLQSKKVIPVNEPLLHLTHIPNATTRKSSSAAYWEVDLHVLRPAGLAHHGTLHTALINKHPNCAMDAIVFQRIPSIVNPVWNSLRLSSFTVSGNGTNAETTPGRALDWVDLEKHQIDFRGDGSVHLHYQDRILPESSLSLALDYNPSFLSLDLFPGDPNRGIELPPVIVRFVPQCREPFLATPSLTATSNTILLIPPLPDMSMPFNVLSMVCTLYAFVIGSILSLSIRKASQSVNYEFDPSKKPKSKGQLIREKVQSVFKRLRGKASAKETPEGSIREEESALLSSKKPDTHAEVLASTDVGGIKND